MHCFCPSMARREYLFQSGGRKNNCRGRNLVQNQQHPAFLISNNKQKKERRRARTSPSPPHFHQIYSGWLNVLNMLQQLLRLLPTSNLAICISFLTFNIFNLGQLKLKMKTTRKVTLKQESKHPICFPAKRSDFQKID